ncbi:uncharacterized protein TNCV_5005331 [Trichonephila clavipes]|nr:uncharacterized protein TNCV_5005331 [Trichonephila clavipes]
MSLRKLGKDELKIVAEELNLTVPEGAKIAGLKSVIVNSDVYKNDKELVQSAIDYALAEIKNKRLDSETKLEFERIKLAQLQKQLELANIQKNLIENSDIRNPSVFETAANINVETLLKSVKTLTIPVPSRVESYNLFFQSLEKAFKIKEVPEQFKGEILLNILGETVNNLLVHVSEEELNNYKLADSKFNVSGKIDLLLILVAFPEVIEIHVALLMPQSGAAVYCKSKNLKSETLVRLITSKSRVAPIKSLTIPRLELCAAVLLAKLVKRVVAALQLETAEFIFGRIR